MGKSPAQSAVCKMGSKIIKSKSLPSFQKITKSETTGESFCQAKLSQAILFFRSFRENAAAFN